jgi:hypothetical protein
MSLLEFYQRTLPPTGVYTLFTADNKHNYWLESLEELEAKTEEITAEERTDCYFGVASFLKAGGLKYGRSQDNVDQLKCFKLDIDAGEKKLKTQGPEKVYTNQQEALAALVAFTKATGLRFSLLVSSGEGLHVYYELDEPIIPEQWLPVAKKFQKFGKAHGLKIDSSVTCDHSRVLRPIGTRHWNGTDVALLKAYPQTYTLQAFADAVGYTPAPRFSEQDMAINADALPLENIPKSFKKIVVKCAAMQHVFTDQEHVEEPLWRLAIGTAKHTVEGFEAAKALSCRHPSYDEEELQSKYDRWETGPATCESFSEFTEKQCAGCKYRGQIKAPIQLGAMKDEEVQALPEELRPEPPAPPPPTGKPWDGCLPPDFTVAQHAGSLTLLFHTKAAKVVKPQAEGDDDDGEIVQPLTIPVTPDIFWFGQWADASDTDDTAQVVLHKMDRNIKRSYLMEQSLMASRTDLTKFLASKGIHLTTDKRAPMALETYAKAQLQRIKSNLFQRPKITDRFGLRILEDGSLVAAHGPYLIYGDGTIEKAMISKGLRTEAAHYTVPLPESADDFWDGAVWKSHIKPAAKAHVEFMRRYYAHPGFEKYQLAIMMGIASPLMAFVTDGYWKGSTLPPNGLSLAMFSENGGKGKTTAMRCAQLAFGLPSGLNRDSDDTSTTINGRLARFSMSGTMPVNMDEMGDMDAKNLAILIRAIANGSGKVRATKDGGLNSAAPWALTCLIGTNKSQREIISQVRKESSAEQFRLLELDVERMPSFGLEAQQAFEREWKTMSQHAGALGAIVHLLICRMGVEKINALVSDKVSEAACIVQAAREMQASRFQYRGLGAMLALNELLKPLNLMPFDMQGMVDEFMRAYKVACEYVDDHVAPTDGLELLEKMLLEMQPNTIITVEETRRNIHVTKYDMDVRGRVPLDVQARHIISSGMTYVSVDAIREWCAVNKAREMVIVGAAKASGVLHRIRASDNGSDSYSKRWASRYNLFKGMRENPGGVGVQCYMFNVHKLAQLRGEDLLGHMQEVARQGTVVYLPGQEAPEESAA